MATGDTEDDDIFVLGSEGRRAVLVGHRLLLLPRLQEGHGLVDAVQFTAGQRQIPRARRSQTQGQCVVFLVEILTNENQTKCFEGFLKDF